MSRDALDCRSPARCATCPQWTGGRCRLEADLELLESTLAPTRPSAPAALRLHDIRHVGLAHA